jgi:hypothetical protein
MIGREESLPVSRGLPSETPPVASAFGRAHHIGEQSD